MPLFQKSTKPNANHNHVALLYLKLFIVVFLVVVVLIISDAASAQYTDIKRLGTSQAVCKKPGVQTADELQAFFIDNADTVNTILNDAGWQGNAQKLFTAIKNGDFTEQVYPVGTTFEWMGMRQKNQPSALPKRRWAGKTSFSGFEVNVQNACVHSQIVIPKICCNIALAAATKVVTKPHLSISVDGNSVTICTDNASNTRVFLAGPDNASSGLTLDRSGCWFGNVLEAGDHTVQATDGCGATLKTLSIGSSATPIDQNMQLDAEKLIPFIAAFAGTETLMRLETAWNMEMRDSSGIAGIRGGLKVPLTQSLNFVPSIGALHRNGVNNGNVYPDDTVFADLGLEAEITKHFFLGGGFGIWDINDGDFREESIFINAGGPITPITEWFIEARGIDSDNSDGSDGFSDNHTFNAGIRLLFR